MATRDLTRRFAELRVLRHGIGGETKRPGDSFSESGLLDVSISMCVSPHSAGVPSVLCVKILCVHCNSELGTRKMARCRSFLRVVQSVVARGLLQNTIWVGSWMYACVGDSW